MFPQEFVIRFAEPTRISAVTVDSYNGMEAVIVLLSMMHGRSEYLEMDE